jgi:hypothetical protein
MDACCYFPKKVPTIIGLTDEERKTIISGGQGERNERNTMTRATFTSKKDARFCLWYVVFDFGFVKGCASFI